MLAKLLYGLIQFSSHLAIMLLIGMNKKIIRSKETLDFTRCGTFATAKEALKSKDLSLEECGFWEMDHPTLPPTFKLAIKVRFMRSDGKLVTRKVLQTVKSWNWHWIEPMPIPGGGYGEFLHRSRVVF